MFVATKNCLISYMKEAKVATLAYFRLMHTHLQAVLNLPHGSFPQDLLQQHLYSNNKQDILYTIMEWCIQLLTSSGVIEDKNNNEKWVLSGEKDKLL